MASFMTVRFDGKMALKPKAAALAIMRHGNAFAAKCCSVRTKPYTGFRRVRVAGNSELCEANVHGMLNGLWSGKASYVANLPLPPLRGSSFFLIMPTQPFRAGLRYAAPTALLRGFIGVHIAPRSAAVKMPALRQQIRIPGFFQP